MGNKAFESRRLTGPLNCISDVKISRRPQEENMSESSEDLGLITVLLQRLETQRLPRALALKEKVD